MENAFGPPLKKFLWNRKEGPTQRRTLCAALGTRFGEAKLTMRTRHRTIYHVWCLRGVRVKQSEECIIAPPEEISDEQKLRGLAATVAGWVSPGRSPCVLH